MTAYRRTTLVLVISIFMSLVVSADPKELCPDPNKTAVGKVQELGRELATSCKENADLVPVYKERFNHMLLKPVEFLMACLDGFGASTISATEGTALGFKFLAYDVPAFVGSAAINKIRKTWNSVVHPTEAAAQSAELDITSELYNMILQLGNQVSDSIGKYVQTHWQNEGFYCLPWSTQIHVHCEVFGDFFYLLAGGKLTGEAFSAIKGVTAKKTAEVLSKLQGIVDKGKKIEAVEEPSSKVIAAVGPRLVSNKVRPLKEGFTLIEETWKSTTNGRTVKNRKYFLEFVDEDGVKVREALSKEASSKFIFGRTQEGMLFAKAAFEGLADNPAVENKMVALLDMDHLNIYNELPGLSKTGDKMIAAMADAIRSAMKESDLTVHFGGDEFLLGAGNISKSRANEIIRNINTSLSENTVLKAYLDHQVSILQQSHDIVASLTHGEELWAKLRGPNGKEITEYIKKSLQIKLNDASELMALKNSFVSRTKDLLDKMYVIEKPSVSSGVVYVKPGDLFADIRAAAEEAEKAAKVIREKLMGGTIPKKDSIDVTKFNRGVRNPVPFPEVEPTL